MGTISFKEVGIKSTEKLKNNQQIAPESPPLGIMTPIREGNAVDGIFMMHREPAAWIKDNLRNLLMTNRGDRVITANLGANLQPLVLENMAQDDFDSIAVERISSTVARYMPYIELQDFVSQTVGSETSGGLGRLDITITYNVKNTRIQNQAIKISFFLGG